MIISITVNASDYKTGAYGSSGVTLDIPDNATQIATPAAKLAESAIYDALTKYSAKLRDLRNQTETEQAEE